MKTFDEIIAPIKEIGWLLNTINAPITFPRSHTKREVWWVQIWAPDFSDFAQGDGATLEIAVARAVVFAKAGHKPRPKKSINLDDLELDL